MKKLLSILICLIMLFSACAFAEGGEIAISNIVYSDSNGMNLDLSGVGLRLAYGENDVAQGLRVALDGNGQNILNGVASMQGEEVLLALDGLSKVYSAKMADAEPEQQPEGVEILAEDLEAIAGLLMNFVMDVAQNTVDAGTQDVGDISFSVLEVGADQESIDALLTGIAAVLDKYPELAQQLLNGSSFSEFYAGLGVKINSYGTIWTAEENNAVDLYFSLLEEATGAEKIFNLYGEYAFTKDAANGVDSTELSISISEVIGEEEYLERFAIGGSVGMISGTEEVYGLDAYAVVPTVDENGTDQGLYFGVYSPEITGTGLWQFSVAAWDESASMDVAFGEQEGVFGVYGTIYAAEGEISFYYEGQNGEGMVGIALIGQDGSGAELMADVSFAEVETDWLNVDGTDAVDVENMTEEQMNSLTGEAMGVLMNAVSALAGANDTIAALIGGMMG